MPLKARRIFRLGLTTALALLCAYALGSRMALPFLAPIMALMLTAKPGPPLGLKKVFGLLLLVLITLGIGLLLIPMLRSYPVTAVLVVAVGLYLSSYLTINLGKGLVGVFLTMGFTMISVAGSLDFSLATSVIESLCLGIVIAVACHHLVYPWFPEDAVASQAPPAEVGASQSSWIALRTTLVVLPVYLLALTNPTLYMPTMMKAVTISQQSSLMSARQVAHDLIASTFVGGCFAIAFWVLLSLAPSLWMFFWLMLGFALYFAAKLNGLISSRFNGAFWIDVTVTMLILLGPAVQDSSNGKDVYMAFFVRLGLFVFVVLYAALAIRALEFLRSRRRSHVNIVTPIEVA